ncbi:MAG TPA: hypothetical protein DDY90_03920 [Clostridiales bacterium]|nr:hypothetical protein [Clostridiales bacterium]
MSEKGIPVEKMLRMCYINSLTGAGGHDSREGEALMAEYELVYEIKNLCRNNQMRDVFFEEVECDDPEAYLRGRLKGKNVEFSTEKGAGGSVTIHAVADGLIQKYVFTPV